MNDGREVRALGRVVRLDLVIAVCALLISSLATAASFWQTQVVQKQLSATVWPYVSISVTNGPDEVKLAIENFGLGPAIVRDVVLTRNGAVQKDLLTFLGPTLATLHRPLTTMNTDIKPGDAIRPGESIVVFDLKSVGIRDRLAALKPQMDLRVCYCSILDQCFLATYTESGAPTPVAVCDEHDPQRLAPVKYEAFRAFVRKVKIHAQPR